MARAPFVAPRAEDRVIVLLVQPPEKFLKSLVSQNALNIVERVAKLIVAPCLVNEIFAGLAGRHDFPAAFATWDDVVPARWNISPAEDTRFTHTQRSTRNAANQPGPYSPP